MEEGRGCVVTEQYFRGTYDEQWYASDMTGITSSHMSESAEPYAKLSRIGDIIMARSWFATELQLNKTSTSGWDTEGSHTLTCYFLGIDDYLKIVCFSFVMWGFNLTSPNPWHVPVSGIRGKETKVWFLQDSPEEHTGTWAKSVESCCRPGLLLPWRGELVESHSMVSERSAIMLRPDEMKTW